MPFDLHKPKQEPLVVIRAASAQELSAYEKYKLTTIEEHAQQNKLENIKLDINGKKSIVDITNKEATIELGELAVQNDISPINISDQEVFFIECALDTNEEETN
jgi:hypothetical protein